MALNPHPQNDFETQTYTFIRRHEALIRRVYNDGIGVPTLGVGFALIINIGTLENPNWQIRPQLNLILQQVGITLTPNDNNILVRVRDLLRNNTPNAQQQITQILPRAQRTSTPTGSEELLATSQAIIATLAPQNRFSFNTITDNPATGQARQLYNIMMNGLVTPPFQGITTSVRNRLGNYINADGTNSGVNVYDSLLNSQELKTILSLAFNNPNLVGPKLTAALRNQDRAEAWFEIRYNSNSFLQPANIIAGLAKRRFAEADTFGLYNVAAADNDVDAKGAFRTLTRHKDAILAYENNAEVQRGLNLARTEFPGIVQTRQAWFQPAQDYLRTTYFTPVGGINLNGDILVGEDQSTLYYKKTTADLLTGTINNDLILGESGPDTLNGGTGLDVIYGGTGNDALLGGADADRLFGDAGHDTLTGGTGDDILKGGTGRDLYWHDGGDGNDTIIDNDNLGLLVLGGRPLSGGYRDGTSGDWLSPDGLIRYALAGTTLTITYQGETLTINNYTPAPYTQGGINPTQGLGLTFIDRLSYAPGTANTVPQAGTLTPYNDADGNTAPDNTPLRSIRGTPGNDNFDSLAGDDVLYGHDGHDRLFGNTGLDYLNGGPGQDRLEGGTGTDILTGDTGDDQLYGDTYTPLATVLATPSNANATALKGDWLTGGLGKDILIGTNNNDALFGGGDADILAGGAGADDLDGDDNYLVNNTNWLNAGFDALPVNRPAGSTIPYASYTITVTDSAALTGGPDQLYGGGGEDRLLGLFGNDYLDGGLGRDILIGGAHNDQLVGGSDDSADALYGGEGEDLLLGGGGADVLMGGRGRDVLYGGEGNDHVRGAAALAAARRDWSVTFTDGLLLFNQFTPLLDDQPVARKIQTNGEDFYLFDSDGVGDEMHGGGGDDMLVGGTGDDQLYGDDNDDSLHAGAGSDLLVGGTGNDQLAGGFGADALYGGDGNDFLYGDAEYSVPWGVAPNDGNDYLDGGIGTDELHGYGGDDYLLGGEGNDMLWGDAGADTLNGGAGADTLHRDANDTIVFDPTDIVGYATGGTLVLGSVALDQFTITAGNGTDGWQYLVLTSGTDIYYMQGGFLGADQIFEFSNATLNQQQLMQYAPAVNLIGTASSDTIYGSNYGDYLYGHTGNTTAPDAADHLYGQGGNDVLEGGLGDDLLDGGEGNDSLRAHAGNDTVLGVSQYLGYVLTVPQAGTLTPYNDVDGNTTRLCRYLTGLPTLLADVRMFFRQAA